MAFFDSILKTFSGSSNDENVMSGGSFINDSQTSVTVSTNSVDKVKNGTAMINLPPNVKSPIYSTWLNHATNPYVIPIDYTAFGELPDNFLKVLNKYDNSPVNYAFNTDSFYYEEVKDDGKNQKVKKVHNVYTKTPVVPSLFNPYVGINTKGTHTNQPLIDVYDYSQNPDSELKNETQRQCDISNCSIWNLLKISTKSDSPEDTGQSVYKLADFMYCKELGKVSNNHLITLRRYSAPIGDNIFARANTGDADNLYSCIPDLAHMVTWFGTEDNKLSNILKMTFHSTWKEMNAEISTADSQADSEGTGILGMIANTLNPAYNKQMGEGKTGTHNFTSWFGGKMGHGLANFGKPGQYQNSAILTNYDQHKIYTPKDTIQSNHYYEGKILFEHEFSLTFNYKIRNYGDISQKAAMHDLINNILMTTFTKGSFWGGEHRIYGASNNNSAIRKMTAFIDDTFDNLYGFTENVLTGAVNWQELWSSICSAVGNMLESSKNKAEEIIGDPKGTAKKYGEDIVTFLREHKINDAIKGTLKNTLGRPALYALNSIVSGEPLGLWHVTIGNPLNPIVTIGNLILTNAELSFGDAPLGLEDFPTELKCVVTLKHCKPRDLIEMEKMFTKGEKAIGIPLGQGGITNYVHNGEGNVKYDDPDPGPEAEAKVKTIEKTDNYDHVNSNIGNISDLSKNNYNERTYQQIFATNYIGGIENNAVSITTG